MQPQRLPTAGAAREALREKGQFWTPDWIAQAMVSYVLQGGADHIFDPAVGAGAFFKAAKVIGQRLGRHIDLLGAEIDLAALQQAAQNGLTTADLASVQMSNFVLHPPARRFSAIVANPPYIRHHRLPTEVKAYLKSYSASLLEAALDGRAGLHIYFLLRALQLLGPGGRLAFIMPADTCEGVFSRPLWAWITRQYRLEAVVTFTPAASPFPQVDTNPMIFLLRNTAPAADCWWAQCTQAETADLQTWIESGFGTVPDGALRTHQRTLNEALATGLSRPPADARQPGMTLGDVAQVWRGIATGANEFFFLTRERAVSLDIPDEFLRLAVGRTRDVDGNEITSATLQRLAAVGRPTLLLSLDARPLTDLPPSIQRYLREGEKLGLPQRPLIAQRRPWYKMEVRAVPPFLFAYLGRRNARFIRNSAGVMPLTGFLCVYPHHSDPASLEKLWRVLSHPETIANLSLVGKSYGAGAIKVEPRALERLPLPAAALSAAGMQPADRSQQASLWG